jgi:catechol 2,3-dioxygenase
MTDSLPSNLTLGYVHLTVTDLDRAAAFYQNALGFRQHQREDGTAYLGAGGPDLLALTEQRDGHAPRGRTGLYHFAVLVPSRLELAQSLKRLAETRTPLQGFADHLVSEAIYLSDPDHNGIEIYRDRPRSEWRDEHGNFRMGTEPLDVDGVLSALEGQPEAWAGLAPGTVLGHMHLKVANLREAKKFYCDLLGFEVMADLRTALFVSAGGYHHHLGMNTWESAGAPPPPPNATGLRYFVVRLPDPEAVDKVLSRVREAGLPVEPHPQGALVRDPSQNAVVFAPLLP